MNDVLGVEWLRAYQNKIFSLSDIIRDTIVTSSSKLAEFHSIKHDISFLNPSQ